MLVARSMGRQYPRGRRAANFRGGIISSYTDWVESPTRTTTATTQLTREEIDRIIEADYQARMTAMQEPTPTRTYTDPTQTTYTRPTTTTTTTRYTGPTAPSNGSLREWEAYYDAINVIMPSSVRATLEVEEQKRFYAATAGKIYSEDYPGVATGIQVAYGGQQPPYWEDYYSGRLSTDAFAYKIAADYDAEMARRRAVKEQYIRLVEQWEDSGEIGPRPQPSPYLQEEQIVALPQTTVKPGVLDSYRTYTKQIQTPTAIEVKVPGTYRPATGEGPPPGTSQWTPPAVMGLYMALQDEPMRTPRELSHLSYQRFRRRVYNQAIYAAAHQYHYMLNGVQYDYVVSLSEIDRMLYSIGWSDRDRVVTVTPSPTAPVPEMVVQQAPVWLRPPLTAPVFPESMRVLVAPERFIPTAEPAPSLIPTAYRQTLPYLRIQAPVPLFRR